MSNLLEAFFIMYAQDFDLVFTHDTDPIDLFCQQHALGEQRQLSLELRNLYEDVKAGRKTLRDVKNLGLEYLPNGERDVNAWFPRFIEHLRKRLETGKYEGISLV